jgi:PST family polysaccharide transporter
MKNRGVHLRKRELDRGRLEKDDGKSVSGRSRLTSNIIYQYALQIAKYLFPFITLPYLTRVLGPDTYAIRAYVLAAMVFFQVFLDYGFNSRGTKIVAEFSNDSSRVAQETSAIVILRLCLCVVGTIALIPITMCIPILHDNALYVAIAYVGVCFKAGLPDFIFQGFQEMGIITKRFVLSQSVAMVLTFVLVHGPQDILWVPTLESLASFIAFVWSWHNVLGTRGIHLCRVSSSYLTSAFRQSSAFFLSNAASTAFSALTTLMIGILIADQAQISYWSLATTAVSAIQSLYTPITNSLYPHMIVSKDFQMLKRLLIAGMVAVTVGTVAFALLSDVVMLVLGGREYLAGSYIVAMLAPVLWFSYPGMLLGYPVLAALGKVKWLTTSTVASALFHVAGLALLAATGMFTIEAICILRCCTEAILAVLRSVFAWRSWRECRGGVAN